MEESLRFRCHKAELHWAFAPHQADRLGPVLEPLDGGHTHCRSMSISTKPKLHSRAARPTVPDQSSSGSAIIADSCRVWLVAAVGN